MASIQPFLFSWPEKEVLALCHHKTGRDAVHTGKLCPLNDQDLCKVYNRSVGGIVRNLRLRDVDQNGAHGSRDEQIIFALTLKDLSGNPSCPHDTIVIDSVVPGPYLFGILETRRVGVDVRSRHNNVDSAVAKDVVIEDCPKLEPRDPYGVMMHVSHMGIFGSDVSCLLSLITLLFGSLK